jgi:ribonuclease-3
MKNNLLQLEKKIGIKFKNQLLLENILIHRSYLNEHKKFYLPSNEKLEFLGDSVLSLITSVYLFKNYSYLAEGDYTEIKSSIVKTESLAIAAINLDLGSYLYLSKGEEQGKGRMNKNIMADCFEALIAGIFLDSGFDAAYNFVLKFLFKGSLDVIISSKSYLSPKTKLQEYFQGKYKMLPVYKVLSEKGPEHNRVFTVGVYFKDKKLGEGIANSKKEAEEKAAEIAFEKRKLIW